MPIAWPIVASDMREHETGAVLVGAPWFPCCVGAGVLAPGEAEVVPVLPVEPQAASKHTRRRLQTLNKSLE